MRRQGVMVRLMLVLAPIACVLSAIAISTTLKTYSKFLKRSPSAKPKKGEAVYAGQKEIAWVVITGISILLIFYTFHCTWVPSRRLGSLHLVGAFKHVLSLSLSSDFWLGCFGDACSGYRRGLLVALHRPGCSRPRRQQDHLRRLP
jgi:dolichyl-diphosphooligosaccharide--protein glycosyltransferase